MKESLETKHATTGRSPRKYVIYSVGDEGRRILFLKDHQLPLEDVIAAATAVSDTLPFRDWIVADQTDAAEPLDVHVIDAEQIGLGIPGLMKAQRSGCSSFARKPPVSMRTAGFCRPRMT